MLFRSLNLSSGAWTVEAWIYVTGGTYYRDIVSKRVVSSATSEYTFSVSNTSNLAFYRTGGTLQGSTTVPTNTWVHAAFTYDGTTCRIFQNGVLVASQAGFTANSGSNSVVIGNYAAGMDEPFIGYISNLRVVKGSAVYTSNFTPSKIGRAHV